MSLFIVMNSADYLVVFYPLVFSSKRVCNFFHSQVGYELILGQLLTSNWIKVSNSLNKRTVLHKQKF
jgi:hypothetical protein